MNFSGRRHVVSRKPVSKSRAITASQWRYLAGLSVVGTQLMVLKSKDVDDSFELMDGFL